MRSFTFVLIAFAAGGLVGWYAHESLRSVDPPTSSTNPLPSTKTIETTPVIKPDRSQGNSQTRLDRSLESGNYVAAMETYEGLLEKSDNDALQRARDQILSHASSLIARQQAARAQQLIKSFLALAYRDVDARILLANAYLAEQAFKPAIVNYYIAKGHAYRVDTIDRLNGLIRLAVTNEAVALKQNNDYSALLELYRYLTELEPDYAPYFIGLARTHVALNDVDAARRSLLLVRDDADVGPEAQAMLAELQPANPGGQEAAPSPQPIEVGGIALYRQGHHFLLDGELGHNMSVRLLIDTGASMTIVTPDILDQAGHSMRNTGRIATFNTANGPVRAPIYIIDSLAVGDWQVYKLEVGVLALGGHSGIDGLLGMNFLRHFQFFIDQNQAVMRLSPN